MAVAGKFRSFEAAFGHVAILTNSVCEDEVSFGREEEKEKEIEKEHELARSRDFVGKRSWRAKSIGKLEESASVFTAILKAQTV